MKVVHRKTRKKNREMKIRERKQNTENKMAAIKSAQGLVGVHMSIQTSTPMPGPLSHHFCLPAGPASLLLPAQVSPQLHLGAICHWWGRGDMAHKLNLTAQMTITSFNKTKTSTQLLPSWQCPYSTGGC